MTYYQFRQAVRIDGQTFSLGMRQVPEEIEAHPDFLHFVNCGWIAECEAAPKQETFSERAQRLAKRLAEKNAKRNEADFQADVPHEQHTDAEDSDEDEEHPGDEMLAEEALTPAQKAARTRKANAEKAKAEKGE